METCYIVCVCVCVCVWGGGWGGGGVGEGGGGEKAGVVMRSVAFKPFKHRW